MLENVSILFGHQRVRSEAFRQVEVGVGDTPGIVAGVLSLNHKRPDQMLRSATEFVALASDAEITAWRESIPFGAGPATFDGLTIALEDASPDSCLALFCLHERLNDRVPPDDWVDYASSWEQGQATSAAPELHFGALLSALTHAEFVTDPEAPGLVVDAESLMTSAMAYTKGLIAIGADPLAIPRTLPKGTPRQVCELHDRAHARLARERGLYDRVLAGALRMQLSMPVSGTKRRMDVDALFMTEIELTGMLKVLLRSDTRAPLGRGYTFWGLNRPALAGTGFDMTVSLDPMSGVDLKDLWIELERAEEREWAKFAAERGGEFGRPRSPARDGMISYRAEPPIAIQSVQPWWEGRPLYTMIAAPREVMVGGEKVPGTRLTWNDVKLAIWMLYAPIRQMHFRRCGHPGEEKWQLLDEAARRARTVLVNRRTELHSAYLSLVPAVDGAPVIWSPSIAASFAAFIDTGRVEMDRLPLADSFDVIEDRGGILVVTARGFLLLDVNSTDDFPISELDRAAREVATTLDCAKSIAEDIIGTIRPLVKSAMDNGRYSDKREALKAIFAAKVRAREFWAQSTRFEEDPLVSRFRTCCEGRWNARKQLGNAVEEVGELESMLVSASDVRSSSTLNAIAFVGFPLSIFGNLLGSFIVLKSGSAEIERLAWPVLAVYAAFSLSALALAWVLAIAFDRRWHFDRS